jgi:hypothetical protein
MLDVVLMATSNILIFSVWYWFIDPPGIEDDSRAASAVGFPLPPAKRPSATLRRLGSPLCGLFVCFLHNELRVQPDRHSATYPTIRRHQTGLAGSAINILAVAK